MRDRASSGSLQGTPAQDRWLVSWREKLLARGTIREVSWEMNARSYTWHRNAPCRCGGNISSPGELGVLMGPTSTCVIDLAPAGIKASSCWMAWPDLAVPLCSCSLGRLEHCIQFGTLVEGQTGWGELRELWWVSSWAGDRRRGGGTLVDLALCHDPRAVEGMVPDSSQMCTAGEEAAMEDSKEKSDWIEGQNSSQR